jgi:hypothetical protein
MRILMALLAALVLGVTPARADETYLSTSLSIFEQMTLWRDSSDMTSDVPEPTGAILRWHHGLRVRLVGVSSSSERATVLKYLNEAAELANLSITVEDGEGSGENFRIELLPEFKVPPVIQPTGCFPRDRISWGPGGSLRVRRPSPIRHSNDIRHSNGMILYTELRLRAGTSDFARCASHEILHGFGVQAHPHNLHSVMNDTQPDFADFTEIDKMTLRTLYHPSIRPGMPHLQAMVAARQILAERLGVVSAGGDTTRLSWPVMDRAVARLRELAEGNSRAAATAAIQLSTAFSLGHYVAVNRSEANRYLRQAADRGTPEAQFTVGAMLSERGNPLRDDKAAVGYLEKAALQNHAGAMFVLGGLLASGRGREADPVAAYAWFILAAERNVREAVSARDNFSASLSVAQIAEAKARAEKLVPQPAR